MARQQNWFTSLPIVMLGLHMYPNTHNFSPFTAVTGSSMLFPRLLLSSETPSTTHDTIKQLIDDMKSVDFESLAIGDCHSPPSTYIPSDLKHCSQVWLRVDRVRKSLEAPYTGPFEVITRYPKFFVLNLPRGHTSVSIDRLKPAYLPSAQTPNPSPPPSQPTSPAPPTPPPVSPASSDVSHTAPPPSALSRTRSGRSIRFSRTNDYFYY